MHVPITDPLLYAFRPLLTHAYQVICMYISCDLIITDYANCYGCVVMATVHLFSFTCRLRNIGDVR